MEYYYYERLNKPAQAAYHHMLEGFRSIASSFPVLRLEGAQLAEVYAAVRFDHPEIFYLTGYKYRYYQDSEYVELLPEYMFEKKKIEEHRKALNARVEKLIRPAKTMKQSDQIKYIHDFICTSVRYDKLKKPYSHEIIGPLGHGVGVCEGIAKTVKILCDALHIRCIVAICGNNPEKGIKYRHSWNVLQAEGKMYHLDATFDNTLGSSDAIRYDYYLLSDTQVFKDHEPLLYALPVCSDGDHCYYRQKKLSFTKMEEVQKRCVQAAKKGKTLDFQWRGGVLGRQSLLELLQMIREESLKKNRYPRISVNRSQAVFRVSFLDTEETEALVEQQANEAENETQETAVN